MLLRETGDWAYKMIEMGLSHHKSVVLGQKLREDYSRQSVRIYNNPVQAAKIYDAQHKATTAEIYTFGGKNSEGETNNMLWSLVFDGIVFHSKPLNTLGTRPEPRYDHAMVALEDYKIIVVHGGRNETQDIIFNDLFVFVPESMVWSRILIDQPGIPPSLASHSIAGKFTDLYIFGGLDHLGYSSFHVYKVSLRRDNIEQLNSYKTTTICRR